MSLDEVTSSTSAAPEAAEEAPKKRAVRRVKKADVAASEEPGVEKTPAARKPRTRKAAAPAKDSAPAEGAGEEAAAAPAPKKRGRRSKAEIEAAKAAEAAKADGVETAASVPDEAPAEKPKTRKPRTRKAVVADGEGETAEKPAPKKRGRRSKAEVEAAKAADAEALIAAQAAILAEITAEKSAEQSAEKKDAQAERKPVARMANSAAVARRRRAERMSAASQKSVKPEAKPEPVEAPAAQADPVKKPVVQQEAPRVLKYGEEATGRIIRTRPGRSSAFRAMVEQPQPAAGQNAEKPSDQQKDAFSKQDKHSKYDKRDRKHFDKDGEESEGRYGRKRRERDRRNKGEDRQDRDSRDRRDDRQNGQDRDRREERQSRYERERERREERRQRREERRKHEPLAPKTNKEELAALKVAELRAKAAELEIDAAGLKKAELVEKVYEAAVRAEGFIEVEGILETLPDGYGFLRTKGYLPSEGDVYVGTSLIRRNNLRKGDYVKGQTRPTRENEKFAALQTIATVNGKPLEELGARVKFGELTPIYPDECLKMEHGKSALTARVIDLVSPIGKGQRGLIVSPPKAGKTTVLKDIAAAIAANNPEVHLMCLLVDERPEEVTDMQRSIKGEVISSTFDMPTENHIQASELVIERAKRLVEEGKDVVVLLDSLTRLARAYNLAQPASGRILSGGVDSSALYPPKKFLGAARNIEGGGSLTILASALIETGSKMDEVIFEEFKGTGNMELKLDRYLADRRIFPAIDPVTSGTRKEDLLLNPQEAPIIWALRSQLANAGGTDRAMDMLIKSLKRTNNNDEFLMRFAKKAQVQTGSARDDSSNDLTL